MRTAELVMTAIGTGLQVLLCFLLFSRAFFRQFRFFTLCIILSIAAALGLIATQKSFDLYLDVYWATEAVSVVLTFFALQESFYLVFRNFLAIPWFRVLFPAIGILMIFIAILRAIFHPVSQAGLLTSTLISLEIAVGFLQVGIFFLFIVLVQFFHMKWQQQAFGVVLGFGIAASGTLVVYLLRSEFGTKLNPVVRITPPLAYIAAVIVWLATFLRKEQNQPMQDKTVALTPEQMIFELRRYTRAVKGILER
jgi:hypothetical protein